MSKEHWNDGTTSTLKNSNFKREASRCVYENDDILVSHAIMTFPNASKEAAMWVAKKRMD